MADHGVVDTATIMATLASFAPPDLNASLSLNDVVEIAMEGQWVGVVLRPQQVTDGLAKIVHQHLTHTYPWLQFEVRLGDIVYRGGHGFGQGRHIVAVLGGKGGVGKSTTAVNLALTLSALGITTGLVDGDLHGPDIPHMLNIHPSEQIKSPDWRLWSPTITPPSRRLRPYRRYGIEVMSTGFVIPETLPPELSGSTVVSALLRHLIFEVAWTAEVIIVDAPPGTGEELRTMAGTLPLSGAIFVTTPQDLAQMDASRTLTLLVNHGVPVIGLVQNMAYLPCPRCGEEVDMFPTSSRLVNAGVNILGRIPFDARLSTAADQGSPLVLSDEGGSIAYEFGRIGSAVRRWLRSSGG
jgi:ATP-binding protein involved in chromosome partitioning